MRPETRWKRNTWHTRRNMRNIMGHLRTFRVTLIQYIYNIRIPYTFCSSYLYIYRGTPVEEHATRVAHVEAPKTCENMKNTRIFCHSSFTQAIFGRCPCSPLSAGPFQRSSGQIHLSHQSQQLGGDPRKEGLQGVRALKDFPKPQSPSRSIKHPPASKAPIGVHLDFRGP